jgi:hypothetical protein
MWKNKKEKKLYFLRVTPNSMSRDRMVGIDRCENLKSNVYICLEFEVLAAVVMKCTVFCNIAPGGPLKIEPTFWRSISPPSSG